MNKADKQLKMFRLIMRCLATLAVVGPTIYNSDYSLMTGISHGVILYCVWMLGDDRI